MNAWVTADLHFGHANIINYCNRPYDTVREMNEGIIERWNVCVEPDDVVWVLGDVCMGQLAETIPLVERLNGFKMLVPGNHDPIWSGCPQKRKDKWREEFSAPFATVLAETFKGTIGEEPPIIPVIASHFPYIATDSRDFDEWRPVDKGDWLLHGHVHDHWLQRGRQINVGIDAWGGWPASVQAIHSLMVAGENDLPVEPWLP